MHKAVAGYIHRRENKGIYSSYTTIYPLGEKNKALASPPGKPPVPPERAFRRESHFSFRQSPGIDFWGRPLLARRRGVGAECADVASNGEPSAGALRADVAVQECLRARAARGQPARRRDRGETVPADFRADRLRAGAARGQPARRRERRRGERRQAQAAASTWRRGEKTRQQRRGAARGVGGSSEAPRRGAAPGGE